MDKQAIFLDPPDLISKGDTMKYFWSVPLPLRKRIIIALIALAALAWSAVYAAMQLHPRWR
jgi:hypothetical protein